jgi:hypothetical protein
MNNRPIERETNTLLKQSQRDIEGQLSAITAQLSAVTAQLERQADSTFSGKAWAALSLPGFAGRLVTHGKALIELGERLKSGALPQWKIDQDEAYKNAALGRLASLSTPRDQDPKEHSKTSEPDSVGSVSDPGGDQQGKSDVQIEGGVQL